MSEAVRPLPSAATPVAFNGSRRTSGMTNSIDGRQLDANGLKIDPSTKISDAEEIVFQRMAYRKLERQMRGTYKNDKPWTILWTFLTLLLLFGVVAPEFVDIGGDEESGIHRKKSFDIQINIRDLGFISLMAIITVGTLVYTLTRVVVVVRWSLYWLLATLSILYLWKRQINLFSNDTPTILLIAFGVMEFLTFFIYIIMNFIYPPLVRSEFFRKHIGITWWFGLKKQSRQHWTLTYAPSSWFEGRRTCTYRGETDAEGLPHGFGNWLDDSFHGELLSGMWDRGIPVGPFRSREFGSGFAFESLMIGYVHCSDDTFTSRNYFPSQLKLPTCGVASVECSVAGGFFSHLPRAEIRNGPFCLADVVVEPRDEETGDAARFKSAFADAEPHFTLRLLKDIIPSIKVLYTEHPSSSLIITATRGRGVIVSGHTFEGQSDKPAQLVIDVVRGSESIASQQQQQATMSTATSSSTSSSSSSVVDGAPNAAMNIIKSVLYNNARTTDVLAVPPTTEDGSQVTDALGSSLVLPDDVKDNDDVEDEDDDVASDGIGARGQHGSAYVDDEGETYRTPRLSGDGREGLDAPLLPGTARTTTAMIDDPSLFFNLSHIPAATLHNQLLQQQNHLVNRPHSDMFQGTRMLMSQQRSNVPATVSETVQLGNETSQPPVAGVLPGPYLRVREWRSTVDGHVEALIFFPGFNASLEHSLERMGQFMAMGRFPPHIKPLVFSWPCAREATYLWAKSSSSSPQTHAALAALLRGLEEAGVRDIHFLVHSLGARVVCTALRDDSETGERSEVSQLFQSGGMRLRTLTLLNPDTPLSSFIHEDFKCLRRVCDHITVVGDRKDGALDWSELGNGLVGTLTGIYELFTPRCFSRRRWALCCRSCLDGCCRPYRHGIDRLFSRILTVGKNIFSLYVRAGDDDTETTMRPLPQQILQHGLAVAFARTKDGRSMTEDEEASFDLLDQQDFEVDGASPTKRRRNRRWLDVDVIDTSSMETNVHQLRHAYFDLNKILVEDLHELIVTGRRAAERSLLLHREGNIFSFCQAPACVVNK